MKFYNFITIRDKSLKNIVMERCTCGQTGSSYYPDENQCEPDCWDCYYQAREATQQEYINSEEHELPF
jgi:hypothetical protein